jgi:hypothetical protein
VDHFLKNDSGEGESGVRVYHRIVQLMDDPQDMSGNYFSDILLIL